MFTYVYYDSDKSKVILEQFANGQKRILFESSKILQLKESDKIDIKQVDNYYHIYINGKFFDTYIDI